MAEASGSDAAASVRLQIASEASPEAAVLKLSGELDIASAPDLERALQGAIGSSSRQVMIDLSELSFMDSTGLRALLHARQQANEGGHELTLRTGPRQVQRVFELSGTIDTFTFVEG